MKIKRIFRVLAFALMTSAACAQETPAGGGRPALDPATLTERQIAQVQVPQVLFKLAEIYKRSGDAERLAWSLQRLSVLRPDTGDLRLALAMAYAGQGEKSKTYDLLLSMQKQGFGYDLARNENFAKVADTRVWTYIVENLKKNLEPFGQGKVAFSLPGGDHLYESLAFDPARKQFLVGSVRDGTVSLAGKDGKLKEFIKPEAGNGLWSVYALAVDPEGRNLYVASTASVYFKGFAQADYGKAGVFKFDLATGKLVDKYLLAPAAGQEQVLSSLAVGRGGRVFAADGVHNIIYRLDGGKLKVLVENPRLTSVRGLALSDDGQFLYFADWSLGLFGVDLAAGKGFDFDYDRARLVLGGIDGLYWYDHTLVAIENGMSPRRVMRLHLDGDGRSIAKAVPLDAGNPAFELPTYGAIDGDGLYFVANSQKNAYDTYGTPKDGARLEPVHVFRSDLRFAWDEPGISLKEAPHVPALLARPREAGPFGNVEAGAQTAPAH